MSFQKWASSTKNPLRNASESVQHSMRDALRSAYNAGAEDERELWVVKLTPKIAPFTFEAPE